MAKSTEPISGLKGEIAELRHNYPALKDEDLFLTWFLRAYVTEDVDAAAKSVTNGPKDKGVDAVFIDDSSRSAFLVQGKYRHALAGKNETHSEIMGFAQFSQLLTQEDGSQFKALIKGADPSVAEKLSEARNRISRRDYRLWLYYVTLGRCSAGLRREAETVVRASGNNAHIEIIDGRRLHVLMEDYLDGVAPPIPSLDLFMEGGRGISVNGILQRYDTRSRIESWVFSMQGDAVAELYEVGGKRLFARNIRGFLGDNTDVNRSMEGTLRHEPERFFYYNNGITILCDDAKRVSAQGKDTLRVINPQIINGQQTTRTLALKAEAARKASVLVRVIQVPRDLSQNRDGFDSLLSQIVGGTNWQNAIRPSDLVSNDRRQVELQREFRKRGYLYLRKRESKSEARRAAGTKQFILLKKEDLARAVAGCDLDPVEPRHGVENLFSEETYTSIFPTSEARYYLMRYWLMNVVSSCSRGYPQRGYAKWVVLGYVWSRLSPLLKGGASQEAFIRMTERGQKELDRHLSRAIDLAFTASLAYWRKNRGSGKKAIDVSTFFRNKRGRDQEFRTFWGSRHNKVRARFEAKLRRAVAALNAEV
jgi:hypothetical protein